MCVNPKGKGIKEGKNRACVARYGRVKGRVSAYLSVSYTPVYAESTVSLRHAYTHTDHQTHSSVGVGEMSSSLPPFRIFSPKKEMENS